MGLLRFSGCERYTGHPCGSTLDLRRALWSIRGVKRPPTSTWFLLTLVLAVSASAARADRCCGVLELRQYTVNADQRDTLIDLFEREFVESQEAAGMRIVGTFRDLDAPNRFVWVRGFADMDARGAGLSSFYYGPVWSKHRTAANATIADVDDVLLLKPVRGALVFDLPAPSERAPVGASRAPGRLVVATIYPLVVAKADQFPAFFQTSLATELIRAGASIDAAFVTETSANNFSRLPIREGERVFVWFARFADSASFERFNRSLTQSARWQRDIAPRLGELLQGPPQVLRLAPTPRSQLR